MVKNIWLLRNGFLDLDKSVFIAGTGYGQRLKAPVFSTLLETTEMGYVIIDTGLNTLGIKDREGTWGSRAKELLPLLEEEDDIACRLKQVGVETQEINYVINTHMHWDHTGGHRYFKRAKFIAQRSEYRFAFDPDPHISGSYMRNHFNFDLDYELIDGDQNFCEGVELIFTPGHTPGHMSVMVTKKDGKVFIFSGDAVYMQENLERMKPPGNCWDTSCAMISLNRIKTLARLMNAKVFPAHDPDYEWVREGILKI